jgi:hypothetical protein
VATELTASAQAPVPPVIGRTGGLQGDSINRKMYAAADVTNRRIQAALAAATLALITQVPLSVGECWTLPFCNGDDQGLTIGGGMIWEPPLRKILFAVT